MVRVGQSARNTSRLQIEEPDLPRSAELDVGKPLIAEPEPAVADIPHDAEIIADERADDDE
jgi:hypothetical protein